MASYDHRPLGKGNAILISLTFKAEWEIISWRTLRCPRRAVWENGKNDLVVRCELFSQRTKPSKSILPHACPSHLLPPPHLLSSLHLTSHSLLPHLTSLSPPPSLTSLFLTLHTLTPPDLTLTPLSLLSHHPSPPPPSHLLPPSTHLHSSSSHPPHTLSFLLPPPPLILPPLHLLLSSLLLSHLNLSPSTFSTHLTLLLPPPNSPSLLHSK
ncbi:hypothetical protein Pcinc_030485 [Petrolisthes cinctipes]|uniref:Uncharacterized protein n=1 Tax=Petrolisthes cinctipes TaxID=88211 RepID=A0AAE1EYL5_PETCI|nr:hypothetical protein Pcinc_030485 [Petrolisthes cinctipes]